MFIITLIYAVKAVVHSSMSVIEVALVLFTLITEFSRVRVRGSSCRGFREL